MLTPPSKLLPFNSKQVTNKQTYTPTHTSTHILVHTRDLLVLSCIVASKSDRSLLSTQPLISLIHLSIYPIYNIFFIYLSIYLHALIIYIRQWKLNQTLIF